ncbi:2-keto-4-pentenoate hydratase [Microbacteriaceae bacterium 4G12]
MVNQIDTIARKLYTAERDSQAVTKFTDQYPDLNAETAYSVQERLIEIKCSEEQAEVVGYKLGLTSKAKQEMMGVHEPTYGVLLENMQVQDSEVIKLSQFIHPKIEPEIAFIFNKELKGPVSVPEVLAATAYVAPALEVIDSRYENFRFTLVDVIADNSSSSRFIIGETFTSPSDIDLKLCGMVFKKNGEIMDTGAGAAVMGHPARAIAWMINKLTARGQTIQPGDIVLSGALCGAVTAEDKDLFTVSIDGLGSVSAKFSE